MKALLPAFHSRTQSWQTLRLLPAHSQHSCLHQSSRQRISQHLHTPRLQSSSRAPCLNKTYSMFLGNDETISHKRQKKKFPNAKRLLGKPIKQFPCQDRKKRFDIQALHPWQKSLLCRARERREAQGEKRRPVLTTRWRTRPRFHRWGPNLRLHSILPKVLTGAPPPSRPLTRLKQQM